MTNSQHGSDLPLGSDARVRTLALSGIIPPLSEKYRLRDTATLAASAAVDRGSKKQNPCALLHGLSHFIGLSYQTTLFECCPATRMSRSPSLSMSIARIS